MAPIGMAGWVVGAAVQMGQPQLWPSAAYVAMCTLAGALLALLWWQAIAKSMRWRGVVAGVAALLVGGALGFGSTGWRAAQLLGDALPAQLHGRDVRVQAVVENLPQATQRGQRWQVRVEAAWAVGEQGQPIHIPQRLALQHYEGGALQVHPGERWLWTLRLRPPSGTRNPLGFDAERWWWTQGIRATGYVRMQPHAPQRLGSTWHAPVQQLRAKLRTAMYSAAPVAGLAQAPPSAMGVVVALVAGDQAAIGRNEWALFRDTGVAHLVSISGLHITMFAWLATALLGGLWRRSARACLWCPAPVAASWAGWVLAAAYAVLSGWGVPAQRTVGMLLVVVVLRTWGLHWPWPLVWLGVLWAVVLWDPWVLLQAGFWLSFVAVGVLFAVQPPQRSGQGWRGYGRQLLKEQWVLGVALAPLTLLLFGQISVVGLVANLWAVPWVTMLLTPLAMLGALWAPLWTLAAWAAQAMLLGLAWMAQWPLAVVHVPQAPWPWAAAGLLGAVALVCRGPWWPRLAAAVWLLPLLLWQVPRPPVGGLHVLALDVGQGGAVLLRTAHHSLLFDAGPSWGEAAEVGRDAGAQTILPLLRAWGVRLDYGFVSHGDGDHMGGAASVAAAQPQVQWWGGSGTGAGAGAGAEVGALGKEAAAGLQLQPCLRGQAWHWDGVQFEVLSPPAQPMQPGVMGRNNAGSCVLQVTAANGAKVLLTGDIEAAQERALLQSGLLQPVDMLLVPHHGSRTSSTPAFVQALQPKVAIAQAGYANRYGHPHPSVVQRYQALGTQWADSAHCGAAHWNASAPAQVRCERALAQRYWQR